MNKESKIYVAGHRGMVGSAIVRLLEAQGYNNLLLRSSTQLDLRDQTAVNLFFKENRPDYVILAAAKVGGILANNTFKAEFLYDNLMIQTNVIHASYTTEVQKLLFLGSSCIYPKFADIPIREDSLLTGPLEPTNEPYAIAKIAGIKLCQSYRAQYGCNFISAMPTNLYGPGDNFIDDNAHVLPALMRRIHEAKRLNLPEVEIWGSGKPLREFMHVDDLADACLLLMNKFDAGEHINVGSNEEISIYDLAVLIKEVIGYKGEIALDQTKPDGTFRKLMDGSQLHRMGWKTNISLKTGLQTTYKHFLAKI